MVRRREGSNLVVRRVGKAIVFLVEYRAPSPKHNTASNAMYLLHPIYNTH